MAKSRKTANSSNGNGKVINEIGKVGTKQSIGVFGGISMVVGAIIGSGIFISPKQILEGSGSVGLSLLVWLLGGALSMCGALSYVELGTMIPRSGGEYVYLIESLHPVFAFIFSYISILILRPVQVAVLALTSAKYLLSPFIDDSCSSGDIQFKLLALLIILLLGYLNCIGGKEANTVMVFLTVLKILMLVFIALIGIYNLSQGKTEYLYQGFEGTNTNLGRIAIGFYSSMWAYDGWNNLNFCIDELHNPSRNLPLAIFIGIPLVTLLYLLANISYFTVLSPEALLNSPAVAMTWAEATIGQFSLVVPICVAISAIGSMHSLVFTAGRLVYTSAYEGHMLKSMAMINIHRSLPIPAILFNVCVSCMCVLPANLETLIDLFSFVAWVFYAMVFACLIYLRYTHPHLKRPYKVNLILPVVAFLVAVFIIVAPIVQAPQVEFLFATLVIFSGLIFYFPFVLYKKKLPGIDKLNIWCQLIFQTCMPDPPEITTETVSLEVNANTVKSTDQLVLQNKIK